ncbi:MAG: Phasin, partial [Roseicyclus sp.]|nr:Phasin [Roseicyclus sp.]
MAKAASTTDFTKVMSDMMGSIPMDMSAFGDVFKNQAAVADKMTKVALEA